MYIMSCSEVMYQAYYPYLYQRAGAAPPVSAHPVPRTGPFSSPFGAAHQYDRVSVNRTISRRKNGIFKQCTKKESSKRKNCWTFLGGKNANTKKLDARLLRSVGQAIYAIPNLEVIIEK